LFLESPLSRLREEIGISSLLLYIINSSILLSRFINRIRDLSNL